MSIKSFRDKRLKRLFEDDDGRGIDARWLDRLGKQLNAIDTASELDELGRSRYPGWRLHSGKGEWNGYWSIDVSRNWRLYFRFEDGDAFDLFLYDPH
jgi:toxin HigB-1